jgi:fluoride ion exporter CrcB/FEX
MQLILVGPGGVAGAVARWAIDGWASERTAGLFPSGTLEVNLSGSFLRALPFA